MNPFTRLKRAQVSSLGEMGLIREIRHWLGETCPPPPAGIGDDCAVLSPSRHPQVVTVDPVIYGRHFNDSIPPAAVGAKLLKRNLSDLAAMGARPRAAVVAVTLDETVSIAWIRRFYQGMARTARRYDTQIVGGDIAAAPGMLCAALTLIGEAANGRVLPRQGAREGDLILVTGTLGGSILGHHHRFTPRLAEGQWLARQPQVRTMMDVSDGLAKDLGSLTTAGLIPALDPGLLPIRSAARALARHSGRTPVQHALEDGEDYELVFTLRAGTAVPGFLARWRRNFSTPLTVIGRFVKDNALPAGWLNPLSLRGYEHLR